MKKIILLIVALFSVVFSNAQNQTSEKEVTMSLGTHNAFVLDLDEITEKEALDYFTSYFKGSGKFKKNKKADEYFAEEAKIRFISHDKVDVYAKIEDLKDDSRLYVWVDHGQGFISSSDNPEAASGIMNFMNDFAVEAEKKHVQSMLNDQEKSLKSMERDLSGLEKDQEKYEKNIEQAKEAISKNEANIEENAVEQKTKQSEIDAQNVAIEKIKERLSKIGKAKKAKL